MARTIEDMEGMLAGVRGPTAEDLAVNFIRNNPNAPTEKMAEVIQRFGADINLVADQMGVPRAEANAAYNSYLDTQANAAAAAAEAQRKADEAAAAQAAAQAAAAEQAAQQAASQAAANAAQTVEKTGLEKVQDFISEGGKTDRQIYREMVANGVGLEEMAGAVGMPIDDATVRYTRAQELVEIDDLAAQGPEAVRKQFPNGVPANLIRRYVNETGGDWASISANMDKFGVTVDDVASATGRPVAEIQGLYAQGRGDTVTTGAGQTAVTPASASAVAQRPGSVGQTGLAGAERASGAGLAAANQAIANALATSRGDILGLTGLARGELDVGAGQAAEAITGGTQAGLSAFYQGLGGVRTDLQAAQEAAAQQYRAGLGDITAARDLAAQQVADAFGQAGARFDPYSQAGQAALQQQLALSGALGQEAFQQAYQESPQMQFLREQGERAALRTAAARGGLGGGRVMQELSRFNTGLASQDLQQQIGNLAALGGQGLQATGQQAQLGAQAGQLQAGLQTDAARQLAAQRGQLAASQLGTGGQLAGLGTMAGQQGLSTLTGAGSQLADIASGRALAQSQLASGAGRQLADIGMTGGLALGANLYGTGQDISAQRFQAGRDIASNIQAQIAALSALQSGQGADIANLLGGQASTLAGIQGAQGSNISNLVGGTAGNLANIATNQAATYNPASLGGVQSTQGILGSAGQAGAAGALAGALPGSAGTNAMSVIALPS